MSPHKTNAIILKMTPFRESSSILYLLTPEHGLAHGVAKGVRQKRTGTVALERGFLVETLLYGRPHRDLHTLGSISVLDYYPSTRTDLFKNVVRDIAFEVLLKTMSCDSSHPEVFSYCLDMCGRMEATPADTCFPVMLWRFFFHFARLMGVAPDLDACSICGSPVQRAIGAFLRLESGGLACPCCMKTRPDSRGRTASFLPPIVVQSLKSDTAPVRAACCMPASEVRRITWLLARYCQYHFHHISEFKSLAFLDSILPDTNADASAPPTMAYEHETINY
jgi:DNA repair protein RecO (recombination protein O)